MKNENKAKFSMGFWFSVVVLIENVVAIGMSTVVVTVLNEIFGEWVDISPAVLVFLFSITIGIVLTFFINKLYLAPTMKLNESMSKVAKGDFTVRLEDKMMVKETANMYNNFNLMVEELGSLETIQSDFVSNVSHEFKTPINAIEGYSMLLQGCKDVNKEQLEYVEKILFNTKRLSTLVGNILLLAKLDNKNLQSKRAKFRLDEQIRQCILAQEIQWVEKEIELDVEMEDVEFCGTSELLQYVWSNLLNNAIKFSPQKGVISMRLGIDNGRIVFTIKDNGAGIQEKDIAHVFDKFYQSDSTRKMEGSGLGLALAKRIVEVNDGEIFVQNNQDKGCTFTVKLPVI
ncbi:MAG: HAMP domain-containing histidine kinase [Clostridia bacterium]|nr:HAMP domain-containing histidine kinase [Clostridia bacterium]